MVFGRHSARLAGNNSCRPSIRLYSGFLILSRDVPRAVALINSTRPLRHDAACNLLSLAQRPCVVEFNRMPIPIFTLPSRVHEMRCLKMHERVAEKKIHG